MSGSLFTPQVPAIAKGAQDQQFGFNMLMKRLTGRDTWGGGPFDSFMEQFLGPIATAVINAQGNINGPGADGQPKLPINVNQIFDNIGAGLGGASTGGKNIYQYLSDLGQQALANALGGAQGQSFDETSGIMQTLAPLLTMGMTGGNRSAFYRQQNDILRGIQNTAAGDPTMQGGAQGPGGNSGPTWGQTVQNSPFFHQYYPGRTSNLPTSQANPAVPAGDPRAQGNVSM